MINEVRNTVMFVLNKDNNGYITPEAYNSYARQAQIEVYEQMVFDYNNAMVRMNNRMSGSGYGDIPKYIREAIDKFSVANEVLTYNVSVFDLPTSSTTNDWFHLTSINYNYAAEIEKVNEAKVTALNNSLLTAPTTEYPVYTQNGNSITVYPASIVNNVLCSYLRYPVDPKWTYVSLSAGEPVFDQSANDYQDFELPKKYMPDLVIKILEYAGVSIRESEVVQIAKTEEIQRKQLEQ